MNDDELAHAWESFATALREVPGRRMERWLLNEFCRTSEQESARRQYEMLRNNPNPYVRGIRPGIFGLGIML